MTAFACPGKMRRLRGTHLDIFGYTAERKRERADIDAHRKLIGELVAGLHNGNYALAGTGRKPPHARGFGYVKDRKPRAVLPRSSSYCYSAFHEAQSATHTYSMPRRTARPDFALQTFQQGLPAPDIGILDVHRGEVRRPVGAGIDARHGITGRHLGCRVKQLSLRAVLPQSA